MIQLLKRLNKDFALMIVLLFIALMSLNSLSATNVISGYDFFILWLVLGTTFIVLYAVRFKRKAQVEFIDYVKLSIIIIWPSIPILNEYALEHESMERLLIVGVVYFPSLFFIYVIDRVIIKYEAMNKKLVVVFAIMSFVVLVSIVYAFVQTVKAQAAERSAVARQMELEMELKTAKHELEKTRVQLDSLRTKR